MIQCHRIVYTVVYVISCPNLLCKDNVQVPSRRLPICSGSEHCELSEMIQSHQCLLGGSITLVAMADKITKINNDIKRSYNSQSTVNISNFNTQHSFCLLSLLRQSEIILQKILF